MRKIMRVPLILATLLVLTACTSAEDTEQTTAKTPTVEATPTDHVELTPVPTEAVNPIRWAYVSDDNVQRVIFPDDAWKIEQKTEDLVTFSKSNTGMVTLRKTDKANETFPRTEEEAYTLLKNQGYEDGTYTISDFSFVDQLGASYWYRVLFEGDNTPYASGIFRGAVVGDHAYEIAAMIFRDDATVLDEAQTIVQSFTVVLQDQADDATAQVTEMPAETAIPTAVPAAPEPTATPIPEPTAIPAPVFQPFYATCISSVSMRTAPSDGPIIGDIVPGTVVYVTGVVNNWYQFDYNGTVVYSYSRYFQVS